MFFFRYFEGGTPVWKSGARLSRYRGVYGARPAPVPSDILTTIIYLLSSCFPAPSCCSFFHLIQFPGAGSACPDLMEDHAGSCRTIIKTSIKNARRGFAGKIYIINNNVIKNGSSNKFIILHFTIFCKQLFTFITSFSAFSCCFPVDFVTTIFFKNPVFAGLCRV